MTLYDSLAQAHMEIRAATLAELQRMHVFMRQDISGVVLSDPWNIRDHDRARREIDVFLSSAYSGNFNSKETTLAFLNTGLYSERLYNQAEALCRALYDFYSRFTQLDQNLNFGDAARQIYPSYLDFAAAFEPVKRAREEFIRAYSRVCQRKTSSGVAWARTIAAERAEADYFKDLFLG